jgi:hypothetical protein
MAERNAGVAPDKRIEFRVELTPGGRTPGGSKSR